MRSPVPYALFFGPVYCLLAWPAGGAETQVSVSKEATVFSVEAVSRVSASQRVAWETLTDYARYPRFVPNLGLSRLASRNPLRVQQKGDFGILFFRKEIYATFDVAERPPSSIRFHAVEGNLKSLDTEVSLEERAGATSIRYHSTGFLGPAVDQLDNHTHQHPRETASSGRGNRAARCGRHVQMSTLQVVTYNIHKGFSQFKRHVSVYELRERLRGLAADIVFLQEVQGSHSRHQQRHRNWPEAPQYEFLADVLWRDFAYGRNAVYDSGHHGNA